eukprot:CAMPEP_0197281412 /NCGR_PEP_ID=MMETSP1432-20130617/22716_1 /TAXON_ID=44447 /ORGANISM="Pseudo-nitzschia delicatissima, Strain UNC1205" /LENGTH=44 /DNA_ID= /DNA_START= /DNA_END= /DNA_ORIENTATION=
MQGDEASFSMSGVDMPDIQRINNVYDSEFPKQPKSTITMLRSVP